MTVYIEVIINDSITKRDESMIMYDMIRGILEGTWSRRGIE